MTSWGEAAFDAYLPADMVLGQADIAVVVTDRLSNLLYVNEYAVRLFRISGDVARLAGCPPRLSTGCTRPRMRRGRR